MTGDGPVFGGPLRESSPVDWFLGHGSACFTHDGVRIRPGQSVGPHLTWHRTVAGHTRLLGSALYLFMIFYSNFELFSTSLFLQVSLAQSFCLFCPRCPMAPSSSSLDLDLMHRCSPVYFSLLLIIPLDSTRAGSTFSRCRRVGGIYSPARHW